MAEQTYFFRSSLHGFHREDVISFIGELTRKHEAELQAKQEELRIAREEIAALRQQTPADAAAPAAEPTPVYRDQELEAYRRAERFEREAKQRAGELYGSVFRAIDAAGTRLKEQEAQLQKISEVISGDITALSSAMEDVRGQLADTRSYILELEPDSSAEQG